MTARCITIPRSEKPTRVFLVERFDQLARQIESALLDSGPAIGLERAPDLPTAAEDLTCLDADYVLVNVDEFQPDELRQLSRIRQSFRAHHVFGLSGDPSGKAADPAAREACEQLFPLTSDLSDLKRRLHPRGA